MTDRNAFRFLVIAEVVFALSAAAVDSVWPELLPEAMRQAMTAYEEARSDVLLLAVIALPALVLAVVSLIGLLFFWRPARWLYVVCFLLNIPGTLLLGPNVTSAPVTTLFMLAEAVSGMILVAMFVPPVARHFERGAQQGAPGDVPRPTGSGRA